MNPNPANEPSNETAELEADARQIQQHDASARDHGQASDGLRDESAERENFNDTAFQNDDDLVPVVGLGGSAGSIGVLQRFFRQMAPDSGMAFVVIVHLSPHHESYLASLLQHETVMPVVQVIESVPVEPNRVYVISPNKHLEMQDGHIVLSEIEQPRGRRVAVDLFFRTLSASRRSKAVAVVLSGTDSDGAIGLKRVKECGGVTIAQDPDEAEYDGMPRAAIETGLVDWILPVDQLPVRLLAFKHNEDRIQLPPGEAPAEAGDNDETALREILSLLRARTGHDFAHYKRATILRRIARRLQVNSLPSLPEYLAFLRVHPGEAGALLQDLLISVTNFFRDGESFAALAAMMPRIFAGKTAGQQVRVWVAGCATGEEAYSVAMLLCEHAATLDSPPAIQVFATDIDDNAIRSAREGFYPQTIAADVSPERLRRFFSQEQGRYRVRQELREMILFASHNLLGDSPFSRLDLATCRNLLIYFGRRAQDKAFEIFHFALRPEGTLFLGGSEGTEEAGALFSLLDKRHRLYSRRTVSRAPLPMPQVPMPVLARAQLPAPPLLPHIPAPDETPARERPLASFGELHLRLLEQHAPPSVLVNEDYDIVHLSARAGRFLTFGGGEMSVNLLGVVHPDLRLELRTMLFQATQTGQVLRVAGVPVDMAGQARVVDLEVRPMRDDEAAQLFLLVVFDELQENAPVPLSPPEPVARRLEEELQHLKAHVRSTVEQHDASIEELKASNEELQAINEELRSTAEELETSQEELQSVNEEVTTVNLELKNKVEEVSRANSDLQNLMASTDIATIFLDSQLRITRYTPRALSLFRLIPTDLGRPLSDLSHILEYPEITGDAQAALDRLATSEREVLASDGRRFLARVVPYRTVEDHIDGAILTFVDISRRWEAETSLRQSKEQYRLLVAGVEDYAILFLDPEGLISTWNTGAERLLGWREAEVLGQPTDFFFVPEDRASGEPQKEQETARREGRALDERWHLRRDGSRFFVSGVMTASRDEQGNLRGFSKIMRDITSRQDAEAALRRAHDELELRVQERTHELARSNEILREEVAERQQSEQRFSQIFHAMPIPMAVVTCEEGRFLDINQAGANFFGLKRDAIVGLCVSEIGNWSAEAQGLPDTESVRHEALRLLREGQPVRDMELRYDDATNSCDTLYTVVLVEHEDKPYQIAMFLDVTERKQAERAREELLQRIVNTQEDERRRISRELHDQMGQSLTALMMGLKALPDSSDVGLARPSPNQRIQHLQKLTDDLMERAHRLAWELHPPALDNLGLEAALRQFVSEWSQNGGLRADFMVREVSGMNRLPSPVEMALYRVVQESLTNVSRHARATSVCVMLERRGNDIMAIVEDDGQGFDTTSSTPSQRLGLMGMRERMELVGGTLTVESAPGEGTTIYARVPITNE